MALADIINKILEEAKKEAEKMKKETLHSLKKYEEDSLNEIKTEENQLEETAVTKKKEIDRKLDSTIKMEERNELLKTKRGIIKETFENAIKKLNTLPDKEYEELLQSIAISSELSGYTSGDIISPSNRKKITEKIFHKINPHLKVKEGNIEGGFKFESDNININNTFETLMTNNVKPLIESEVAKILF